MVEKYRKLDIKWKFYRDVHEEVGTAENTMASFWFSQSNGFRVPAVYHDIVIRVLNRRLKCEKHLEKQEAEFYKNNPL